MSLSYKSIAGKLKTPYPAAIDSDRIFISQYNTRHDSVDARHIESLAGEISGNGFHPGKALHVNEISGKKKQYELIVGVNRFRALKQLQYKKVLCYVYRDLTPEEMVFLDVWDNKSDELHKPYHFLQEGEHYLLLQQKGWTIRKIADLKGMGTSTIHRKIQIARLPKEAKKIIIESLNYKDTIFEERNFRPICALKDDNQIIEVCKAISEIGRNAAQGIGQKLENRQIQELINTVKTNPNSAKADTDHKGDEYMQQEFNFDLTPFQGRGNCTIPAWILDVMLHPGISGQERDFINYLVKETYAHNPQQSSVMCDTAQIQKTTRLPLKSIPGIIETLLKKGIIINSNGFLSIRDIDKNNKQQTMPQEKQAVAVPAAAPFTPDKKDIDAELKKLYIENKNLKICREIVIKRGGMSYLQAQIRYCQSMHKEAIGDSGYYIAAIKRNFAKYNSDNDDTDDEEDKDPVPQKPIKKVNPPVTDPDKLLQDQYNAYIRTEICNRLQNLDANQVIELQTRLIQDALNTDSRVLNPPERDYLTALFVQIEKSGTKLDNDVYRPIFETAIDKLYINHFNLPAFQSWKNANTVSALV